MHSESTNGTEHSLYISHQARRSHRKMFLNHNNFGDRFLSSVVPFCRLGNHGSEIFKELILDMKKKKTQTNNLVRVDSSLYSATN